MIDIINLLYSNAIDDGSLKSMLLSTDVSYINTAIYISVERNFNSDLMYEFIFYSHTPQTIYYHQGQPVLFPRNSFSGFDILLENESIAYLSLNSYMDKYQRNQVNIYAKNCLLKMSESQQRYVIPTNCIIRGEN